MKNILILFLLLISICFYSQTKTFIRDYTYNAGEADSKLTSRTLALQEVKTSLLEEIGTYLQSEFENKIEQNNINGELTFTQLTKSKIITLAAGITSIKIIEEKWTGEAYYIKAEIIVDNNDLKRKLFDLIKDKAKTKELEDLQEKNKEANEEIARLKKEFLTIKTNGNLEVEKNQIKELFNHEINTLDAIEFFEKAYSSFQAKEYQNSIDYYFKSLQINAEQPLAYNNIGVARYILQDYLTAISDYNKALKLSPNFADAYNNRGLAKFQLADYRGSISDFYKAVQINPLYSLAFFNSGNSRFELGDYKTAILDFNKAIEIDFNYQEAYFNRGNTKYKLGQKNSACIDWSKSGELGNNYAFDKINENCQ